MTVEPIALSEREFTRLGAYWTPQEIVTLVFEMVRPYAEGGIVFDPGAGCGAFMKPPYFVKRLIANEIVPEACEYLRKSFPQAETHCENFLLSPEREKFGIGPRDRLVIVGNPPYNDPTSKYKRGVKKGSTVPQVDPSLASRDIGISFFRAFARLQPDAVCVLHPLSYLIKKTNFAGLKEFKDNYTLKKGVIFSSSVFKRTRQTPFPVVAALYIRGGKMDYNYINSFEFEVLGEPEKRFVLSKFETIDGYIRKYPPRKEDRRVSDIGLYMFTFRDLNSLLTTANFTERIDFEYHITIHYGEFYKYAYLNCMKRYFPKHYLLGNLSPLVKKEDLEKNERLRDLFVIDTILNNQHLSVFSKDNPKSIIWTRNLAEKFDKPGEPYSTFTKWLKGENFDKARIARLVKDYFNQLLREFLS
jgi:hypothetical protein